MKRIYMKETYPTTITWPYLGSVALLLALALAPPHEWPRTIKKAGGELTTWVRMQFADDVEVAEAKPTLASTPKDAVDRVVVAFDPRAGEVSNEAVANEVASNNDAEALTAEPIQQRQPFEVQVSPPVSGQSKRRASAKPQKADERSSDVHSTNVQSNSASRAEERYVWQPPENWEPGLIEPLSSDELAAVTTTERQSPSTRSDDVKTFQQETQREPLTTKIVKSTIEGPVANRVARVPKIERREFSDETFRTRSDAIQVAPKSAEELSTRPQLSEVDSTQNASDGQPIDLTPAEDTPPQPTLPATQTDNVADAKPSGPSSSERTAQVADVWPRSEVLGNLLKDARNDVVLANWGKTIESHLTVLQGHRVTGAVDQTRALAKLRELATVEVDRSKWPQKHRVLHDRLRLSLLRRLDVWQPLMKVAYVEPSSFATYRAQKSLLKVSSQLLALLDERDPAEAAWIDYLALPTLQQLRSDKVGYRELAEQILLRMKSPKLTADQQQYLQSPGFRTFETQLRNVVAKSVHPADMMAALEAYETTPNRNTANDLILLIQRWRSAPNGEMYRPAIDMIVSHYRNANFRISVSEDLINRFVPAIKQYAERVNDNILGAAVTGQSSTHSNLAVKLMPDESAIRLGLLAAGTVASNTASRKGPVTAFSRGKSAFAAGKEIVLGPNGVFTSPTETRASSGNTLLGIETDWDDVPFIGSIVRSMAKDEIVEQRRQVEAQMQLRVRRKAQQRMDRELATRVSRAEQNLDRKVVEPLRRLELNPRAMEMRTTNNRAIIRTRLASDWQLGSHTPRPQLRADSKMSLQIHQSAANNIIEQLNLQNRRMTLDELMSTLSQRFGMPLQVANEENRNVIVEFADHPLEFEFERGQIQVTIHFAELQRGKKRWKNFSIRGNYRADVQQLDIALHREDSVSLIGDRIGLRDQLALRGIAAKVFGKHQRLQILSDVVRQQPKLRNLSVTQFTIRDGWLAVAFGEESNGVQRVADRSAGLQPF